MGCHPVHTHVDSTSPGMQLRFLSDRHTLRIIS